LFCIEQEEVPKDCSSGDVDFGGYDLNSPLHSPVYEDEAIRSVWK
jgi:hypothetical protein